MTQTVALVPPCRRPQIFLRLQRCRPHNPPALVTHSPRGTPPQMARERNMPQALLSQCLQMPSRCMHSGLLIRTTWCTTRIMVRVLLPLRRQITDQRSRFLQRVLLGRATPLVVGIQRRMVRARRMHGMGQRSRRRRSHWVMRM